jgi:hypothetical protein
MDNTHWKYSVEWRNDTQGFEDTHSSRLEEKFFHTLVDALKHYIEAECRTPYYEGLSYLVVRRGTEDILDERTL